MSMASQAGRAPAPALLAATLAACGDAGAQSKAAGGTTGVAVAGTFETYEEDATLYARIVDSSLVVG